MIESTPTSTMTDAEVEAWFAAGGITATVVTVCPEPACRRCASVMLDRAA